MRIGELTYLKWIDIDAPHKTINITPEKGSNPPKTPNFRQANRNVKHTPKNTRRQRIQPTQTSLTRKL